jgi:hypothetical protein
MAEELTTYQVEVLVEVKMVGDEDAAYTAVDEIMQRAWDTDDGRKWVKPKWHFEISGPGAVSVTVDGPADIPVVTDETKELSS